MNFLKVCAISVDCTAFREMWFESTFSFCCCRDKDEMLTACSSSKRCVARSCISFGGCSSKSEIAMQQLYDYGLWDLLQMFHAHMLTTCSSFMAGKTEKNGTGSLVKDCSRDGTHYQYNMGLNPTSHFHRPLQNAKETFGFLDIMTTHKKGVLCFENCTLLKVQSNHYKQPIL